MRNNVSLRVLEFIPRVRPTRARRRTERDGAYDRSADLGSLCARAHVAFVAPTRDVRRASPSNAVQNAYLALLADVGGHAGCDATPRDDERGGVDRRRLPSCARGATSSRWRPFSGSFRTTWGFTMCYTWNEPPRWKMENRRVIIQRESI